MIVERVTKVRMEIKSFETEREIVKIILSLLDQELSKMNFDKKYLNNVKLHKILYYIIEDLHVEITRSWYKRGCYVWPCYGLEDAFLGGNKSVFEFVDEDLLSVINPGRIIGAIRRAVQRHNILFRRLEDVLQDLYFKDAPEKFRKIYLSNLRFKRKCDEFINQVESKVKSNFGATLERYLGDELLVSSEIVSEAISGLHVSLHTINSASAKEAAKEAVIDYTLLFEELLIGLEENANKNRIRRDHVDLMREMFEFYDDKVWGLIADEITLETIKGANKEKVINEVRRRSPRLREEVENKKDEFEAKALEMDLFPSERYLAKKIEAGEVVKVYSNSARELSL